MTGGEDVGALLFGEEPSRFLGEVVPDRDIYDLTLIRKAVKRGIPVFGICRGIQCLNIAMGGDMIQDIPSEVPDAIQHRQNARGSRQHDDGMAEQGVGAGRLFHGCVSSSGRVLR